MDDQIELFENWENLSSEVQDSLLQNNDLNVFLGKDYKLADISEKVNYLWDNSKPEIQEKYKRKFIDFALELTEIENRTAAKINAESEFYFDFGWGAPELLQKMCSTCNIEELEELFEVLLKDKENKLTALINLYAYSSENIQQKNFNKIFSILEDRDFLQKYATSGLEGDENLKKYNSAIDHRKKKLYDLLWESSKDNVKKEHLDVLSKMIERKKEENEDYGLISLWENLSEEIQGISQNELEGIVNFLLNKKSSTYIIKSIWEATSETVQSLSSSTLEAILEYNENNNDKVDIWKETKPKAQIENSKFFEELLKLVDTQKKPYEIKSLWEASSEEFQEQYFQELLNIYKSDDIEYQSEDENKIIGYIWQATKKNIQINNQDILIDLIKHEIKARKYIHNKQSLEIYNLSRASF
jgi:hypothetical protein